MGLILPQTIRVRTHWTTCKHYREKGYEFEKCGDIIEVNVMDLHPGSHEMVKVVCDICGKEREMCYYRVVECNEEDKLITCGSKICELKKREDTCTKKYGKGIINVFQAEEVKEKIKNTNLERYSCENPMQNEEIRNKEIQTLREKYGEGIINISQVKEIQEKIKNTNLERYGCEYAMQNEEIQNKVKATNLERHGVEHVMQNEEIKNKAKKSCQALYGVDNFSKSWRNERTNLILLDKKHFIAYLSQIPFEQRTINYLLGELDIKDSCLRTYISKYECQNLINYYRVKPEQEIKQLLD